MPSFYDVSLVIVDSENSPFLERCIRSCVAQTFPGRMYEILVVNAGLSGGADVIPNYERLHQLLSVKTEMTPTGIMKAVLRNTAGRFLVFVESSDFLSDYMLLFETVFLYDNPSLDGVAVDYWLVDPNGDQKVERVSAKEQPIMGGILFRKDLLKRLFEGQGLSVFEWDSLIRRLYEVGKIAHLPISFYRKQGSGQ